MAQFKIFLDKSGMYRFILKTRTKQVSFVSIGFASKATCVKYINMVKRYSGNDYMYRRELSDNQHPFFRLLKSDSKAIIADSELFLNQDFMEKEISRIKETAPIADIDAVTYSI